MSYSEFIETPRDLAQALADMLGIEDDPQCLKNSEPEYGLTGHICEGACRALWVSQMAQRIADSVMCNFDLDRTLVESTMEYSIGASHDSRE